MTARTTSTRYFSTSTPPPLQAQQGQQAPQQQTQHIQQPQQQLVHINWSHLKPEFSGKPEDAEAHLLHTNDWMNAHHFVENTVTHLKIQDF